MREIHDVGTRHNMGCYCPSLAAHTGRAVDRSAIAHPLVALRAHSSCDRAGDRDSRYDMVLDYKEFVSVCEGVGKPRIFMRGAADGIYLDSPTANSFGMNYVQEQGFAWMEMRSIYDRNKIERVTRDPNGQIRTETTDIISARYEVRETFEQPYPHTGLSMKRVIDRQTGTVMAQAGSANFNGGRMQWVLGVYGTRSCPSAMTDSDDFQAYYYLAQRTLRQVTMKQ